MLLAAACLLPIAPDAAWKPTDAGEPTWRILALLVGLRRLALSGAGLDRSVGASLVCPRLSESCLPTGSTPCRTSVRWSHCSAIRFISSGARYLEPGLVVVGWLPGLRRALRGLRLAASPGYGRRRSCEDSLAPLGPAPSWRRRLAWLALPACGSVALLATTNHVCQDVAVIPFLWVVPLALYLVTFIIAFDHERWYHRRPVAWPPRRSRCCFRPRSTSCRSPSILSASWRFYFSALFLLCMMCHGELVRLKPDARRLTSFYLMISGGGALGGIFVSLVAPMVLNDFWEWPHGAGDRLRAGHRAGVRDRATRLRRASGSKRSEPELLLAGGMFALGGLLAIAKSQWDTNPPVAIMRNFYGVVTVYDRDADKPLERDFAFFSGNIMHGAQFVDPAKHDLPLTYYTAPTGIARTIDYLHKSRGDIRMGVVGLGIGTLAAYAQGKDHFVFYEINPNVVMLARKVLQLHGQGRRSHRRGRVGRRAHFARSASRPKISTCWSSTLSAATPSRSIC